MVRATWGGNPQVLYVEPSATANKALPSVTLGRFLPSFMRWQISATDLPQICHGQAHTNPQYSLVLMV